MPCLGSGAARTLEFHDRSAKDTMCPPPAPDGGAPAPGTSAFAPHGLRLPFLGRGLALQVEEGLLVAQSALRLAVKNRVIVATMRDGGAWNDDQMAEIVRAELDELVAELDADASRLREGADAISRRGTYGRRLTARQKKEVDRLATRGRISHRVAERLRSARDDEAFVSSVMHLAREDSLRELLQPRLLPLDGPSKLTPKEERIALRGVQADLRKLLADYDARTGGYAEEW